MQFSHDDFRYPLRFFPLSIFLLVSSHFLSLLFPLFLLKKLSDFFFYLFLLSKNLKFLQVKIHSGESVQLFFSLFLLLRKHSSKILFYIFFFYFLFSLGLFYTFFFQDSANRWHLSEASETRVVLCCVLRCFARLFLYIIYIFCAGYVQKKNSHVVFQYFCLNHLQLFHIFFLF